MVAPTGVRLLALILALSVTGCGDSAAPEPSAAAENHPVPEECTDPLAGNPATVNVQEVTFCEAEALTKLAGYVQVDSLDGVVVSTSRVNIDPLQVEITNAEAGENSRIILAEGNAYIQKNGKWIQATENSDDRTIAYQSTMPKRFEMLLDPRLRAAGTDPYLEYTVVGPDEVDGVPVTVLSRVVNDGGKDGERIEAFHYINAAYLVLRAETVSQLNGRKVVRTIQLHDVDTPQKIDNPRFGKGH